MRMQITSTTLGLIAKKMAISRVGCGQRFPPRFIYSTLIILQLVMSPCVRAVVLWSDLGQAKVQNNAAGRDILGGLVRRDDAANDTLYFKFHVNPLSDRDTEEYFAALELFEDGHEHLGIGNAPKAWAYSAFFNEASGDYIDLHSASHGTNVAQESVKYEYPQRGDEVTLVFKVQYLPGEDDIVTVWLNPDLGSGATEVVQGENRTTQFNANGSFDEIRLRHSGRGEGWIFSDMAIATSFNDFVDTSSAKLSVAPPDLLRSAFTLNFKIWDKSKGLPGNSVRALAATADGYVWVATGEGLARFDGIRFTSFKVNAEMPPAKILLMVADHEGSLWLGNDDRSLIRWRNGHFRRFTAQDGLPPGAITALSEDSFGHLWIGTESGLTVWLNSKPVLTNLTARLRGQSISAIACGSDGTVVIGIKGMGILRFSNDSFLPVSEPSLDDLLKETHSIFIDGVGRLWIGAGEDSLLCQTGRSWRRYPVPRQLAKSAITTFAEESNGTIWAGSLGGGLIQIRDENLLAVITTNGLAVNSIRSLLCDAAGKLWLGSGNGLFRLERKNLIQLGQSEGLGAGGVQGMLEVIPGLIWAAKMDDGLYRWDGRNFSRLSAKGVGAQDIRILTLLLASDGSCWAGGKDGLLRFKDPRAVADEAQRFDLPGQTIAALAEGDDGFLWIGTREGRLLQLDKGEWKSPIEFTQTNPITAIVAGKESGLWIGTEGSGLLHVKGGRRQRFNRTNGLTSDFIEALHLDEDGSLWIGTAGGGLNRIQNHRVSAISSNEGLPERFISQILKDAYGRLWLGGASGITCIKIRELNDQLEGRITSIRSRSFGRAEGMSSEECASGFSPSGLKSKSGLLWFPTESGIAIVDPQSLQRDSAMPKVLVEDLLVDGVSGGDIVDRTSNSVPLQIKPGKHHIEFHFTALNADDPEQVRFRYKLEGLDQDWVEAGNRRSALYNYVPPGNYQFRVAAHTHDGIWASSETHLEFNVQRYYWLTWWFLALTSVALVASVGGSVRFLEKRKSLRRLKRLQQERALERERARISQDLHDEMGAKLCRISFLSEHARREGASQEDLQNQINGISEASREVLHSLDEIVWAVNPRNDTLEHTASYIGQYVEEYFQMTGVTCELQIPPQLPDCPLSSQIRHHLFLAVHEALTNILKHSGATHAIIAMSVIENALEITIQDNGAGFAVADIEAQGMSATSDTDGLKNMNLRLAAIGGECWIHSEPRRGTNIKLTLPLPLTQATS
jgi:ligand-binding sensor domain-containing protein/signal transduction histidine kinase